MPQQPEAAPDVRTHTREDGRPSYGEVREAYRHAMVNLFGMQPVSLTDTDIRALCSRTVLTAQCNLAGFALTSPSPSASPAAVPTGGEKWALIEQLRQMADEAGPTDPIRMARLHKAATALEFYGDLRKRLEAELREIEATVFEEAEAIGTPSLKPVAWCRWIRGYVTGLQAKIDAVTQDRDHYRDRVTAAEGQADILADIDECLDEVEAPAGYFTDRIRALAAERDAALSKLAEAESRAETAERERDEAREEAREETARAVRGSESHCQMVADVRAVLSQYGTGWSRANGLVEEVRAALAELSRLRASPAAGLPPLPEKAADEARGYWQERNMAHGDRYRHSRAAAFGLWMLDQWASARPSPATEARFQTTIDVHAAAGVA